jgi:imidazolonepropionase-like amidohydrolase
MVTKYQPSGERSSIRRVKPQTTCRPWRDARAGNASDEPVFQRRRRWLSGDKVVRDPDNARRAVRYWAAEGFTSFRVYQQISKDALAAIIDEAHRLGLPVTAHLKAVTCREAAELGSVGTSF